MTTPERTHSPVKVIKSAARGGADITEHHRCCGAPFTHRHCVVLRNVTLTADLEVTGGNETVAHVLPFKVPAVISLWTVSRRLGTVVAHRARGMDLMNGSRSWNNQSKQDACCRSVQYPRKNRLCVVCCASTIRVSAMAQEKDPRYCPLHPFTTPGVLLCGGYITSWKAERRSSPHHSRKQTQKEYPQI